MQVSQVEDHVTHAVIGGEKTIDFGISTSAEFFNILSSTLYQDQMLAVVREVLCNAWDAHIDAGITDKPVEITLTQDTFMVRDFGKGIAKDMIGPIYGVYGNSTKKNDGKQTGGFGLGCKAPFAYTDHFEVISSHAGVRTIYNMSKSSAKVGGKPGIVPIASFPTNETGLQVTIRIKPEDRLRFKALVERIVFNGDMNMTLNGDSLDKLGLNTTPGTYLISKEILRKEKASTDRIFIRYGNVIYPVQSATGIDVMYNKVTGFVDSNSTSNRYDGYYDILFQAAPHSISVTPSRESLSMQQHTIDSLNTLFAGFLTTMEKEFADACSVKAKEVLDRSLTNKYYGNLLVSSPSLPKQFGKASAPDRITTAMEMAEVTLMHRYPNSLEFRKWDLAYRVNGLVQAKKIDRGLAQLFLKELKGVQNNYHYGAGRYHLQEEPTNWVQRHVLAPLLTKLKAAGLPTDHLMVCDPEDRGVPDAYKKSIRTNMAKATESSARHPISTIPYLRNIVVLTTAWFGIHDRARQEDVFEKIGGSYGYLIYHVGATNKEKEAARAFFAKTNMHVVDMTIRAAVAKTKAGISSASKKPKEKGLVCLKSIWIDPTKEVNTRYARQSHALRVEQPEFVLTVSMSRDFASTCINNWDHEATKAILQLFGDKGGILPNATSYVTWGKKGVPSFAAFLKDKMTTFMQRPEVKEYWAYSFARLKETMHLGSNQVSSIVKVVFDTPELCDQFGLKNRLSDEDMQYLVIWNFLKRQYNGLRDYDLQDLATEMDAIPLDPVCRTVVKSIRDNPVVNILDSTFLPVRLKDPQTRSKALAALKSIL